MVLLRFVVVASLVTAPVASAAFGITSLLDTGFLPIGDRRAEEKAVDTLARDLLDEKPGARALLHAHQALRTDIASGHSAAELLRSAVGRALQKRLRDMPAVRLRVLPPVLHWQERIRQPESVRLRGESLVVALLGLGRRHAAILLVHQSIDREWMRCRQGLCMRSHSEPVRRRARYELAFPVLRTLRPVPRRVGTRLRQELPLGLSLQLFPTGDESRLFGTECDPLPSSIAYRFDDPGSPSLVFSHQVDATRDGAPNVILCGPFASSGADVASVTYTVDGDLARPPPSSTHAVFRNPHGFRLP